MQLETIQNRIETTTASLPQAVQSSHGADFAMLISLLDTYQKNTSYQTIPQANTTDATGSDFSLPTPRYLTLDETQPPAVIERLNQAVNQHRSGDFAYLKSMIATRAENATNTAPPSDDFAKMALMASGSLMLDQIQTAQRTVL
ncbi:hypothetical protein [Neptunomonas phycophila]|uniref:hypothetical protein n=1 Tax=Neptunomonas phycophila TaxID=1572645 RepID=UPI0015BB5A1E|nr:hypothetical protein [Neptunomonas phycophila]QLE98636.1 hypothetical protein FLM49_13885 [Neptunomonas phycophila]